MDEQPGADDFGPTEVTVYWRPGCFFCSRLLRGLERSGVRVGKRNIWEDDAARDVVRAHNRGAETVPTVMVGTLAWTNPDAATVTDAVRRAYPDLVTDTVTDTGSGRGSHRPRLLKRP